MLNKLGSLTRQVVDDGRNSFHCFQLNRGKRVRKLLVHTLYEMLLT